MESFEELGTAPELVEALAAEGIERPTPLQQAAIPVVRRENNVLLEAGPGAGLLAAWGIGLLDRLDPELGGAAPRALVLTATTDVANSLGESLARLSMGRGNTVAALGGSWVLPERAQVLLGTPAHVLAAVSSGRIALDALEALVVHQAQQIEATSGLGDVERVVDYLSPECQRVVSALPLTAAVTDFVERHLRRSVRIPAPTADSPPQRGEVRFRITPEPRELGVLDVVAEILSDGDARHVLVFCGSEDRAADVGDYLTLHGYVAGAPGDSSVPVWLGVDALEARTEIASPDGVVVVSCDAPADADALDRRHSISPAGVVVVLPRELPHLKHLGRSTGYVTVPFPPPPRPRTSVDTLREAVERAIAEEDTETYLLALEPLFERHDPAEVAAALLALLRKKRPLPSEPVEPVEAAALGTAAAPAWAKLFIGIGARDGLRPGDLLGAITGEAGVSGDAVGRIEIKDSHSLVEVHDSIARKVIRAINGTTIKGRAVRADFDRPRKGAPRRGRPRG